MFKFNQHLAVIAGAGSLPIEIINYCRSINCKFTVFSLDDGPDELYDYKFRIGQASQIIKKMHFLNVQNIVMVGQVNRPSFFDFTFDSRTISFICKAGINAFTRYSKTGDDFILRLLINEIENEGFKVIGVDKIISNLFFPTGNFSIYEPTKEELIDIRLGFYSSKELGKKDIGQAVVVNNGIVIGEEDLNGTDFLIRKFNYNQSNKHRPILIKTVKPYQDRRVDLPVIGPTTIDLCIKNGFRGIVVEAGGTIVHNKEYIIKRCNDAKMFLTSIDFKHLEHK